MYTVIYARAAAPRVSAAQSHAGIRRWHGECVGHPIQTLCVEPQPRRPLWLPHGVNSLALRLVGRGHALDGD